MSKEEIVKKNLDLHAEFMRYAFEHPGVFDQIPKGATLVILPDDEPELYKENLKVVEAQKAKGLPVVIVRMQVPKPVVPSLEVVGA
ncbi:MAG: hypothetical protein COS84_07745 [Armatimonadetes bacterium CG07_land_8_20_14_0_80_40_9]|nr:MAG: hypothetical protein COS84_07745 [Armatimonadetes bacterium CG07_land_8_20_14_0_80_40_9]